METFIPEVETNEETPIEEEARPYEIIDVQTSYVYLYAIFFSKLSTEYLHANRAMHSNLK